MSNIEQAMEAVVGAMQSAVGAITERHMANVVLSNLTPRATSFVDNGAGITLHRSVPSEHDPDDSVVLTALAPVSAPGVQMRGAVVRAHAYGDVVIMSAVTRDIAPGDTTTISAESWAYTDAREAEECKASILDALAYVGLDLRGEE